MVSASTRSCGTSSSAPLPRRSAMIATGIATAFLYIHIGVLALGLFAAIVVIPQIAVPILLEPKPVSHLSYPQAVALYARVLAHAVHVDDDDKLVLQDAANHLGETEITLSSLSCDSPGHCLNVKEAVMYYRENWDAPGGVPGAVGGEMIPLTSRILAVADVWARLTAAGSPGLTHAQALSQLGSRAGLHFDPAVVAAVAKVVEAERLGYAATPPTSRASTGCRCRASSAGSSPPPASPASSGTRPATAARRRRLG